MLRRRAPERGVHVRAASRPARSYNFSEVVWREDFLTCHSPGWWAEHVARSEELDLVSCAELEDGRRFFEEQALLTEPEGYLGLEPQRAR